MSDNTLKKILIQLLFSYTELQSLMDKFRKRKKKKKWSDIFCVCCNFYSYINNIVKSDFKN